MFVLSGSQALRFPCEKEYIIFATGGQPTFQYNICCQSVLNLSACSYLLKPVGIDQLVDAVEKAEKRILEKDELRFTNILIENLTHGRF